MSNCFHFVSAGDEQGWRVTNNAVFHCNVYEVRLRKFENNIYCDSKVPDIVLLVL